MLLVLLGGLFLWVMWQHLGVFLFWDIVLGASLAKPSCGLVLGLLGCTLWVSLMPLGLPFCLEPLRTLLQASLFENLWEPLRVLQTVIM